MSDLDVDLNKTIAAAVNAKIEASVLAALTGDDVLSAYVSAALQQEVQVESGGYRKKQTTFMHSIVMKAVQAAVQASVSKLIAEESALIEDEIRKALRREAPALAKRFMDNLGEKATASYGVKVDLLFPNNY